MIEAEEAAELVADGMTLEELVRLHGGVIEYGVWFALTWKMAVEVARRHVTGKMIPKRLAWR